jgi:hypothetical protein
MPRITQKGPAHPAERRRQAGDGERGRPDPSQQLTGASSWWSDNGRTAVDIADLADQLHETAEHHDPYEKSHPPHNWWDWYAAYMDAREHGANPDDASSLANDYMAEVKGVVVPKKQ